MSETLRQVGNGAMQSVQELREQRLSNIDEFDHVTKGFPDLGEALGRIERKLDEILAKLNARS